MLEQLNLSKAKDVKLEAYSTGMRQRLSLARTMMHRPKILFLDEPTSGLDPESIQQVNALIRNLAEEEGSTIFLCTHQLRYAQEICTSYGLIDEGMLLALGSLDELRAKVFPGLIVSLAASCFPDGLGIEALGEGKGEITVASEMEIPSIVRAIVEAGGDVFHVSAHRLSLEEIYFSLIEQGGQRDGSKNAERSY